MNRVIVIIGRDFFEVQFLYFLQFWFREWSCELQKFQLWFWTEDHTFSYFSDPAHSSNFLLNNRSKVMVEISKTNDANIQYLYCICRPKNLYLDRGLRMEHFKVRNIFKNLPISQYLSKIIEINQNLRKNKWVVRLPKSNFYTYHM